MVLRRTPEIPETLSPSMGKETLARLATLIDPRREHRRYYELSHILFLCTVAVLAGCNTCSEIEIFGKARLDWFQGMKLFPNGSPSHDTIGRILRILNPRPFQMLFTDWVYSITGPVTGVMAVDGKTSRSSGDGEKSKPIHTVSVYSCSSGMTLAHVAVGEKTNEIPTIPEVIKSIDITGTLVTIDAMGCQSAITSAIRSKKADYLLAVKDNQPALHDAIRNYFAHCTTKSWIKKHKHTFASTESEGHGRIEFREVWVSPIVGDWIDRSKWEDVQQVCCNRSTRIVKGVISIEDRYFITSSKLPAKKILSSIREHWGIENKVHWILDVTFNEDKCRLRKDHSAKNISTIRRWALNMLRAHPSKESMNIRRKKAGWSVKYLEKILGDICGIYRGK
jgi:predicted transposase YbfD/YdcC